MGGWVMGPYNKVDEVCLANVHTLEIIESTDSSGNGSTGLCGYFLKTFHSGYVLLLLLSCECTPI